MDVSSKDVLFTIAMKLELPDLLRWCTSSSRINRDVCNNENVWRSKLLLDYSDYEKFELNRSLRETYVFLYQLSLIKKLLKTEESLYDIYLKEEIGLSGKKLKKIPALDLPNVRWLFLTDNYLTKFPRVILPNLQGLYLSANEFEEISISDLPKLEELDLYGNRLRKLQIFGLPLLRQLNLSSNYLKEIPSFDLPNLEDLDLSNNALTKLPRLKLPSLKRLNLFANYSFSKEEKIKISRKYRKVLTNLKTFLDSK